MWSWAARNVYQDNREQERLLFVFMERLEWLIQPERKAAAEKEKQGQMPDADLEQYAKDLHEAGASEDYIAKELLEIREEREAQAKRDRLINGEDDGDDLQVLRSPRKT